MAVASIGAFSRFGFLQGRGLSFVREPGDHCVQMHRWIGQIECRHLLCGPTTSCSRVSEKPPESKRLTGIHGAHWSGQVRAGISFAIAVEAMARHAKRDEPIATTPSQIGGGAPPGMPKIWPAFVRAIGDRERRHSIDPVGPGDGGLRGLPHDEERAGAPLLAGDRRPWDCGLPIAKNASVSVLVAGLSSAAGMDAEKLSVARTWT